MTGEVYYRYQDQRYAAPVDEFDSPVGTGLQVIRLHAFPVLKHTPAGAWIDMYGQRRFVLSRAHKRFAHPTKEQALESYRKRKIRQISILSNRLKAAQNFLAMSIKEPTQ